MSRDVATVPEQLRPPVLSNRLTNYLLDLGAPVTALAADERLSPAEASYRREMFLRVDPGDPSAELCAEAEAALAPMRNLCTPADRAVIRDWLQLMSHGVGNPPTRADFLVRERAFLLTSGELPRACWTDETLVAYWTSPRGQFWPSAKDLHEVLAPIGAALVALGRRLADIVVRGEVARARPPEPVRGPPSAEERAAIRRSVAQALMESAEREIELEMRRPAKPTPDKALVLVYEAALERALRFQDLPAAEIAKTRLDGLRAKMRHEP